MTQPIPPIGAAAIDAPASPRNPDTRSRQDPATEKVGQIAKIAINPLQDPSPQPIERRPSEEDLEQVLIKRVMEQARQDSYLTAKTIKEFGIKNEPALIEIAKLCAQQSGTGTAYFIQNFGIKDEVARIEIAKLCAQQSGTGTAYFIKNFDIKDEVARIEIARLCAEQNGGDTPCYIKNFDIKDPATLIELARLCACQNGGNTARYIQNFWITDQTTLIEIARLCAEQDAAETAPYIYQFHIQSEDRIEIEDGLIQIIKLCAQQNGRGVLKALERLKLTANTKQLENLCYFQMLASNKHDFLLTNLLKSDVLPALREDEHLPEKFREMLCKDTYEAKEKFQLILFHISKRAYFYQTGREMTPEAQKYLLPIIEYRNRPLATFLARTFAEELDDTEESTKMARYISCCERSPKQLRLSMLIPCSLTDSEEQLTPIEQFIKTRKIKESFKDCASRHLQTWASTAMAFHQSALSQKKKLDLLSQTCVGTRSPAEHIERLSLINALCVLKQEWRLEEDYTCNMTQWLSDLLTTAVQNDDYIDLKEMEDFSSRYMATWGSTRVPTAWLTYEKRLRTLRDPTVQDTFRTMIRSVLDESYVQERYNTEKSFHLNQIQTKYPDLLAKWQEPTPAQPIVDSQEQIEQTFSFRDFLDDKRHNNHFGAAEHFQQLFSWLDGDLGATEYYPITQLCVRLCEQDTLLKDKILQLQQLQQELSTIFPPTQFHNDINDLLTQASQGAGNHNLEIVNTHDWQDLFLSGTEVLGSCQRIDGDPELNKCLMAYVMDGKNRMIAIKEKESGKITTRMIFRLLLDEEGAPVLFLDSLYPDKYSPAHKEAMIEFARQEAARLGLPLFMQDKDGGSFLGTIQSLGSNAPYEYEDAAQGVMRDGVFTISGLKRLN